MVGSNSGAGAVVRAWFMCTVDNEEIKIMHLQGGPKNHTKLMAIILSYPILKKIFHWRIWLLWVPPHHAYVATLPCETLMPEKSDWR